MAMTVEMDERTAPQTLGPLFLVIRRVELGGT